MERSYEKSCQGKIKYKRKDTGQKALRAMHVKHPWQIFRLYKCLYCPHWHIGHYPRIGGERAS